MGRITIVLNDEVQGKLRGIQANKIKNSTKSVSFSSVLNEVVAKSLGVKI